MNKEWWKKRGEAFLDNVIFYGAVALATALVGLAAAFGTDDAKIPLWVVVLFAALLIGCLAGVIVLFRRPAPAPAAASASTPEPPPHLHAALLARIEALLQSVRERKMEGAIPWAIASTFNRILEDARAATGDPVLDDIETYQRQGDDTYAYSGYMDALEASLAQIRVAVMQATE
ncbi:MAG: hypothetical protein QOI31_446 [Solirubrobacterales bacterium]|nr:hypothetical protein [Solirubrobacterales bacterium]